MSMVCFIQTFTRKIAQSIAILVLSIESEKKEELQPPEILLQVEM